MNISEALALCKKALGDDDPGAIDAPAARLLRALGHPVPEPFAPHRDAFLGALAQAVYVEGNESRFRAMLMGRFSLLAGTSDPPCYESGDDWTGDPPDRDWLIPTWCPANRVSMITGHPPGQGKSRLAVQLCAGAAAAGDQWLSGGGPRLASGDCGVAVFATYDLDVDQVSRVLHAAGVEKRVEDRLRWVRPRGPLWASDPCGSSSASILGALTPAGVSVRAYCEQRCARLLVVDSVADAFALRLNDRASVRGFLSDWDLWARSTGCTVLMVFHASHSDPGHCRLADWDAGSRAVWRLGLADTGMGAAPRLECEKSAYAPRPAPIWLSGYPAWRAVPCEEAAADSGPRSCVTLRSADTGTEGDVHVNC